MVQNKGIYSNITN